MYNNINKKSWTYRSGDIFLPEKLRNFLTTNIIGNKNSLIYISYWSIVHLINGIIIASILKQFKLKKNTIYIYSFIIHLIWEWWQIYIGMTELDKLRSQIDILMDTIMFMIGITIVMYQL